MTRQNETKGSTTMINSIQRAQISTVNKTMAAEKSRDVLCGCALTFCLCGVQYSTESVGVLQLFLVYLASHIWRIYISMVYLIVQSTRPYRRRFWCCCCDQVCISVVKSWCCYFFVLRCLFLFICYCVILCVRRAMCCFVFSFFFVSCLFCYTVIFVLWIE